MGPVIFSGIQPTGRKHLGNYIGAIRHYVEAQDRGSPAIFCIVDLHAISVAYDPAQLRERLHDTTAILLAAGLDPSRCILFRQSDVREHTELTWLLSAVTPHGDLNRMTQFKEKSAGRRELVSAALHLYPVLQAADVLAYKATEVPVGEDQRQHIELTREIARRFNERFGETLPVPSHRIAAQGGGSWTWPSRAERCRPAARGRAARSIVLDPDEAIEKKFASAVTDSGREVVRGADKAGVSNLIEIIAAARGRECEQIEREFAGVGYGDFKAAVAAAVIELLGPLRERYVALRADRPGLEETLGAGAEKARAIASSTLAEVRGQMGLGAG